MKTKEPKFFLTHALIVLLTVALTACGGDDDDDDRDENRDRDRDRDPEPEETISGVVYEADPATDQFTELYWVDALGNNTLNLDAPFSSDLEIQRMAISPSGDHVAYIKTRSSKGRALYVAPLDGTVAPEKLNPDLRYTHSMVFSFQWSPDGSRLVYRANNDLESVFELYSVRPDGTEHTRLTGNTFVNGQITEEYRWAPDGSRIAFAAHETSDIKQQLYTVRPDGTGLTAVNGPLIADGDISEEGFKWSPDSDYLAWTADKNADEVFGIFTAKADGSSNTRLNPDPVAGGSVSKGWSFQWAPDSSMVTFVGDLEVKDKRELYAARVDGSGLVKLNGPLPAEGDVSWPRWGADPDRIAYAADEETEGVRELFTVRPNGTDRIKVSGPLVSTGNVVSSYYWSPDGSRIAFEADKEIADVENLYTVRGDGTDLSLVSDNERAISEIFPHREWTRTSESIVFRADKEYDEVEALYIGRADGSELVRLSLPQTTGFGATKFDIAE